MSAISPLRRCLVAVVTDSRALVCRVVRVNCRSFASDVRKHSSFKRPRNVRHAASVARNQHSLDREEHIANDHNDDDVHNEPFTSRQPSASPSRTSGRYEPHRSGRPHRPSSFSRPPRSTDSWTVHREPIGEFVYGFHPVLAALHANKRQVHKVYLQADKGSADDFTTSSSSSALHREREKQQVYEAIQRYSPPLNVDYISRQQLNLLSDNRPHNGVVIDASPLQPPLSDTLPTPPPPTTSHSAATTAPPLWLLLDEVQDPQNLGAIVRSAAFFHAIGLILCKKNCAPLSPVASKASSGCLETVDVRWCRSTMRLLDEAKRAGWRVVGLSAEEVGGGQGRVRDCREFGLGGPTVLVVGNEGRGLRTLVRQSCDELLSIHGGAADGAGMVAGLPLLDSLNVSTAVAIALYQISSKRPTAANVQSEAG